jgi:AcrR family transcriptional regulator
VSDSSSRSSRRGAREQAGRGSEIEEAICTAAERLMSERPFTQLSVADVLTEAGVSRASFYFYFASKYALLERLAERVTGSVFGTSRAWFDADHGDPRAQLRAAVAGAFDTWAEHGPVIRAIIESGPAAEDVAALWERLMGEFVDAAAERIRRDRASGASDSGGPDPQTLAASLLWMTERALYLSIAGGEPAFRDRERTVETLTDVWFRAIYAPSAQA